MSIATRPPRVEDWVLLLCEGCGRPFHLSARQGRAIKQEKRSARCAACRRVNRRLRVRTSDYEFWLERFTEAEIVAIAEYSWGDRDTWPADWRGSLVFDPPPANLFGSPLPH